MSRYSRKAVLFTTIMLLLTLAAWSQTEDQIKTYQLAGTVLNSVTRKPLPRVLVQLEPFSRSVLSGPEGEFSFDDVPQGTVGITLTKPGYFRPGQFPFNPSLGGVGNPEPFGIEVGPEMGKIVLKLTPTATITGTVQGNEGEPLEGARISVLALNMNDGRRELVPQKQTAISDQDGNFRITDLWPGHYYLTASAAEVSRTILGAQSENGGEIYPVNIYFPASTDIAGAERIDLASGQRKEANFALKTVPNFRIAGIIFLPQDWHMTPPMLVDDSERPIVNVSRFDRQDGAFEFRGVPSGTYFLQLRGVRRDRQRFITYERLAVHSNLTNLRVTLRPGFDIPIVERLDFLHGKANRENCTFTDKTEKEHQPDCSEFPGVRLELRSLDFSDVGFQSDWAPIKGTFSIRGVMPGKYTVRAAPMVGGYVQSMRSGGVDLLREPLVVPENGNVDPVEVVLRDDGATLTIKIRKAEPNQSVLVQLFPDSPGVVQPQRTQAGQGDTVYVKAVAPGAYKIFALDRGQFSYASAEEVARYAAQATSIRLKANDNAEVVVDLIHLEE